MDIKDDPRIKELREKLDQEKDPQKLAERIDELMKLIDQIEPDKANKADP